MESFNLDDVQKTVFAIPYRGDESNDDSWIPDIATEEDPFYSQLCWDAYEQSWHSCIERIQQVVQELNKPVIDEITKSIHEAYSNGLRGLPYTELPVIAITNPSSYPSICSDITTQLENSEFPSYSIQLYPSDCPNVQTAMTATIKGFLDQVPEAKPGKKKLLVDYDVETLKRWYMALPDEGQGTLVIMFQDFERFDASVLQDMFYLFSLHASATLPLVFVSILSLPQAASAFLRANFTRSTLALLRIDTYQFPCGMQLLNRLLIKTFFDPSFDPGFMIGHSTLDFLLHYFTEYNPTLASALTILQLVYLKHFNTTPLAFLFNETPSIESLPESTVFDVFNSILSAFYPMSNTVAKQAAAWKAETPDTVHAKVDNARTTFSSQAHRLRLSVSTVLRIIDSLVENGHTIKKLGPGPIEPIKLAWDTLRGRYEHSIAKLCETIREVESSEDLMVILDNLYTYFDELLEEHIVGSSVNTEEMLGFRDSINQLRVGWEADPNIELVGQFVDLLGTFLRSLQDSSLDTLPLSYIWSSGNTVIPDELLNPSVRASIVGALLRPQSFHSSAGSTNPEEAPALSELPDTNILFHRYMDSGKMINVYDWFESFQSVLESQKQDQDKAIQKQSPKKGKGKGKQKAVEEEDEEELRMQAQARFIRALHELDYLGFLKHTGRKADHVTRTVFDLAD